MVSHSALGCPVSRGFLVLSLHVWELPAEAGKAENSLPRRSVLLFRDSLGRHLWRRTVSVCMRRNEEE